MIRLSAIVRHFREVFGLTSLATFEYVLRAIRAGANRSTHWATRPTDSRYVTGTVTFISKPF